MEASWHLCIGRRKSDDRVAGLSLFIGPLKIVVCIISDTAKGAAYVISFGIGASIVIMGAWCLRYSCLLARLGSPVKAYQALPAFHFRTMWQPGGTAGLLWSLGNFCSILSVRFLGVGVGYSVIQASMIVSGLWGIFFFKEVVGAPSIARWMGSAFTTLGGILLLSYTHESLK